MGRDLDRKSEDDWRPRRRRAPRDDHDAFDPYPPRRRSGMVTSVAVLHLVIGPLTVVFGMCGMLVSMVPVLEGDFLALPGGLENPTISVIAMLSVILWGFSALAAATGLLLRAGWSRIFALLLAGCALTIAFLYLVIALLPVLSANGSDGGPERSGSVLNPLVRSLFLFAYGTWTYVVLLHPRRIQEFT